MPVKHLHNDGDLATEFAQAGGKLIVVDFFATWCGPCRTVAPQFEQMSNRYSNAVFVKVDVDQMTETARQYGIRAMPTFLFFKNGQQVAQVQGANVPQIEANIKQYIDAEGASDNKDGMCDLTTAIDKSKSECLNEADDHTFLNLFKEGDYLESDCDEQLILNIAFNQPVKLHSLKFKGPAQNGPKVVKLFINVPQTLDFDQAVRTNAVQELILTSKDLTGDEAVPLKFVKFQNVQNLQLFLKDNQSGAETTRLDALGLHGFPISFTNMGDFARVAGKKGELDNNPGGMTIQSDKGPPSV
ncbi:Thioredoxin-like protein 1 [Hypsibius exemplaris]|uniref:Thioredoxin-like protein 1 n=1 Tax=Hypsibius exemplaris TaxID=2072580 RepID=A0A1W0XDU0_HYPEX|nr:Thioredoxin-like protein 1 [Hypsibius exemplaris]